MSEQPVDDGVITFKCGNPPEPVMTLTKQGFVYKGQLIEDAGEAHRLFIDWCKTAKAEKL
jgi:hypothetical protein